jgi:hypothetical protein
MQLCVALLQPFQEGEKFSQIFLDIFDDNYYTGGV